MTNPYIQSFIQTKSQEPALPKQPYNSSSVEDKKQSLRQPYLKPERPHGYLVRENALESAGSSVTGLAKTYGYFYNAVVNGKGNDYTVGRINDGAKFLGSLGIAAALASRAPNPKAKVMEFVGFATWFSSMALWPKVLNTGIKAVKGVDLDQEYVDSYGRRKRFFEDSQYLTWDLYSNKELDKMGDKLGVPKDIENRHDAIKEKAKQVAIQGNTLMMLTAGFATPVMTGLICNRLERPVTALLEKHRVGKAQKGLEALNNESIISVKDNSSEKLNEILGAGDTAHITAEKRAQLNEFFESRYTGSGIYNGVKDQLAEFAPEAGAKLHLDDKAKEGLRNAFLPSDKVLRSFSGESEATFTALKGALDVQPDVFAKRVLRDNFSVEAQKAGINRFIAERLDNANIDECHHGKIQDHILENLAVEAEKHKKYEIKSSQVRKLLEVADDHVARRNIAGNYWDATVRNIADSKTANHWEVFPKDVVKALELPRELKNKIENGAISVEEALHQHLTNLTKPENKDQLERVVNKLAKIAQKVTEREEKAAEVLVPALEKAGSVSASNARKSGFSILANSIKESTGKSVADVNNKVFSTESTCFRLLQAANVYTKFANAPEGDIAAKEARETIIRRLGIDNAVNKWEEFLKKSPAEVKAVLDNTMCDVHEKLPIDREKYGGLVGNMNSHHNDLKWALAQLPNEIKGTMSSFGGEIDKAIQNEEEKRKLKFDPLKQIFGEKIKKLKESTGEKTTQEKHLIKLEKLQTEKQKKLEELTTQIAIESNKAEKQKLEKQKIRIERHKGILEGVLDSLILDERFNKVILPEQEHQQTLQQIIEHDKAINKFKNIKNPNISDWTERLGKNFNEFIKDGIKEAKITNTWFMRVAMIAVPLTAISMFAISQFGQKNKYNPDVYEKKGTHNKGK